MLKNEAIVAELKTLLTVQQRTLESVKRKRSLRDSEKAMWAGRLACRIEALAEAIDIIGGQRVRPPHPTT
jgi:hypothetical protein